MVKEIAIPAYIPIVDPSNRSSISEFFQGLFSDGRSYYRIVSRECNRYVVKQEKRERSLFETCLKIATLITPLLLVGVAFLACNSHWQKKRHFVLQEEIKAPPIVSKPIDGSAKLSPHPTFVTSVKEADGPKGDLKEVAYDIVLSGKSDFSEYFQLVTSKGHILGKIWLCKEKKAVVVAGIDSYTSYRSHNVGRALHEFAIRYSFAEGYDGRLELDAVDKSDGFHFKCGYRYVRPQHIGYVQFMKFCSKYGESAARPKMKEFASLCEEYLSTSGDAKTTLETKIKNHFAYQDLIERAKKELKREPIDLRDAISYGVYLFWDANTILERWCNRENGKNCKSAFCNPPNNRFEFGSYMTLAPSERDKWRSILSSCSGRSIVNSIFIFTK